MEWVSCSNGIAQENAKYFYFLTGLSVAYSLLLEQIITVWRGTKTTRARYGEVDTQKWGSLYLHTGHRPATAHSTHDSRSTKWWATGGETSESWRHCCRLNGKRPWQVQTLALQLGALLMKVVEPSGGGALLEETAWRGWALGFYNRAPLPAHSLLPDLLICDVRRSHSCALQPPRLLPGYPL